MYTFIYMLSVPDYHGRPMSLDDGYAQSLHQMNLAILFVFLFVPDVSRYVYIPGFQNVWFPVHVTLRNRF